MGCLIDKCLTSLLCCFKSVSALLSREILYTKKCLYNRTFLVSRNLNNSHVLPINHHYVQRIVPATSPQSMNVGAWCENYGQLPLRKINIRSHSRATTNQHLHCSKERHKGLQPIALVIVELCRSEGIRQSVN